MSERLKAAVIGVGGFGNRHLRNLLDPSSNRSIEVVAAIDRTFSGCRHMRRLEQEGVALFESTAAFFERSCADLVIVVTPPHLHLEHVSAALQHGAHVFCEKPVAPTVEGVRAMAAARDAAERRVAVGFQWSYSRAIRALKADVAAGRLGRPIRFRTLISWPRSLAYYARPWAGRLKSDSGEWVLDSPVSNASLHQLHNALYILGDELSKSAEVADVQAELYRANAIENCDTAALRMHAVDGPEILHYVTHAAPTHTDPVIEYAFEDAVVTHSPDNGCRFTARFADGRTKDYGDPDAERCGLLDVVAEAIVESRPFACEIETALPVTLCANLAQRSVEEVVPFPAGMCRDQEVDGETYRQVPALDAALQQCFSEGLLPSELPGLSWARAGKPVSAV